MIVIGEQYCKSTLLFDSIFLYLFKDLKLIIGFAISSAV